MPIDYLSDEWIAAATRAVAASAELAELATTMTVRLTQVVTDTPNGTVVYHLGLSEGRARFGPGEPDDEQIRFVESYPDALRLARGEVNAQELLIAGRLSVAGDPQSLLDVAPVIDALDTALATVRADTAYPAG